MKAGAKTPWLLAAVAALLGLYILIFERRHETTDEARAAREHLFAGLNRGEVTAIEIDRGAKGRVVLTRPGPGNDTWRVDPGGTPAASGAIGDLLDTIDGLDVDRTATASAAAAGLDPPAARLTATSRAERFILDVGSVDASGRGSYVRRDGDARVFVVGRRLRDLVDRDAGAFRDRRLFAATGIDAATTLSFRTEGTPPRTLRKRAGLWLDEQGTFATRASLGEVLRLLAALQASGFPATAPAGSPAAPHRVIDLGSPGAGARLEIWDDACGGDASTHLAAFTAAATAEGSAGARAWVCVDGGSLDRLWRQLEAANRRDPHLVVVDPAGIDDVALSEGDRRLRLHRNDDGSWRFAEPTESYGADAKVVGDWLVKLAEMKITAETPPARAGAPGAVRKLLVAGATRIELEIAPPHGGQSRLERAGEVAPALIGAEAFAALDPEPLRFRSRAVLALPQFDVHALELRTPRSRVRLRREPGADWARDGDGAAPDTKAVDHLLGILSDLRAEEFVTPPPAAFKTDTTVDVEVRSGETAPQHRRLELGAKCRARADDTPVFTLPARTCDDIERTIGGIH